MAGPDQTRDPAGGFEAQATLSRRDRAEPSAHARASYPRSATMDVHEVLNHARDAMTVKRVFGDPYEKDGVTVIPVANVMGGAGGGGGSGAGAPSGTGDAAVADG